MSTQMEQQQQQGDDETTTGSAREKIAGVVSVRDGAIVVTFPGAVAALKSGELVWSRSTGKTASPAALSIPSLDIGGRVYGGTTVQLNTKPAAALDPDTRELVTQAEAMKRAKERAAGSGAGRGAAPVKIA